MTRVVLKRDNASCQWDNSNSQPSVLHSSSIILASMLTSMTNLCYPLVAAHLDSSAPLASASSIQKASASCRVVLEVDQSSGSTHLLEVDLTTGSNYLWAYISCVLSTFCVSVSSCHQKTKKLLKHLSRILSLGLNHIKHLKLKYIKPNKKRLKGHISPRIALFKNQNHRFFANSFFSTRIKKFPSSLKNWFSLIFRLRLPIGFRRRCRQI